MTTLELQQAYRAQIAKRQRAFRAIVGGSGAVVFAVCASLFAATVIGLVSQFMPPWYLLP